MATKLQLWHKAGRFVTGIVVLCFFLPFFGVSCQGMDVITMTGADMVGGCKPGGMIADAENAADDMGAPKDKDSSLGPKMDKVNVEPLAIVALACAVIGFGLAWVRSRGALIGTLVVSLAGLGALAGLYVKVTGDMDRMVKAELDKKKHDSDSAEDQMGGRIRDELKLDAGGRMGLWLTGLGMVSIAMLAGMAMREKSPIPVATAYPGGPPPGPPPGGFGPPPGGYPPQGGGYPPQGG